MAASSPLHVLGVNLNISVLRYMDAKVQFFKAPVRK